MNRRNVYFFALMILCSCNVGNAELKNRQKVILNEIKRVKAAYYKTTDSLDKIKSADTSFAKQNEIALALVSADRKRTTALIKLQREFDSLDKQLKRR